MVSHPIYLFLLSNFNKRPDRSWVFVVVMLKELIITYAVGFFFLFYLQQMAQAKLAQPYAQNGQRNGADGVAAAQSSIVVTLTSEPANNTAVPSIAPTQCLFSCGLIFLTGRQNQLSNSFLEHHILLKIHFNSL